MSFSGFENFSVNTGQFTETHFSSDGQGTLAFNSPSLNEGTVSYSGNGYSSSMFLYTNSGGTPGPGTCVSIDSVSSSYPNTASYCTTNPGFYLNGANFVMADTGPVINGPAGNYFGNLTVCSGGSKRTLVTTFTFNISAGVYRKALAINGTFIEFWIYVNGVWNLIASADVSAFIYTNNLVGWLPGFSVWCNQGPISATVANLQWGPRANLLQSLLYFNTKFVDAQLSKAIMIPSPGKINPRIYPPNRDVTVRVK